MTLTTRFAIAAGLSTRRQGPSGDLPAIVRIVAVLHGLDHDHDGVRQVADRNPRLPLNFVVTDAFPESPATRIHFHDTEPQPARSESADHPALESAVNH